MFLIAVGRVIRIHKRCRFGLADAENEVYTFGFENFDERIVGLAVRYNIVGQCGVAEVSFKVDFGAVTRVFHAASRISLAA